MGIKSSSVSGAPIADDLPDEIMGIIMAFLPVADMFRCGRVCRRLHKLTDSARTWYPRSEPLVAKRDLPTVGMRAFYCQRFIDASFRDLARRKGPLINALESLTPVPAPAVTADGIDGLLRIVVVGAGGVGKSALTQVYVRAQFEGEYDPTIEDSFRKAIVLDGRLSVLEILDTVGQEEYSCLHEQYLRAADGLLMAYDITSMRSALDIDILHRQLMVCKGLDNDEGGVDGSFPIVVVGNKCDLSEKRQVRGEDGRRYAEAIGAAFFETSARSNMNVSEAFEELTRRIRTKALVAQMALVQPAKKKKSCCCVQ